MNVVLSFSAICFLLVLGKFLRVKIRFFQKLYLPASVIAGLLGLLILQFFGKFLPPATTSGWNKMPGFLINIVFAALFLGITIPPIKKIWQKSGPQLAYGQIVAWGQYLTALGISLILITPLFKIPAFMGTIVPVGFEGGHGTAGGLKPTFEFFNWSEGGDYALASATVGVISAIIVGMALINWAARKGYTQKLKKVEDLSESSLVGIYNPDERPSAGKQTVSCDSVDSLAFHLGIIGMAVLIGYLMKVSLVQLEGVFSSGENRFFAGFPLFPLCMIGGLIVQLILAKFSKIMPIDHQLMQRLSGTSMDFLVVAAIATIRLSVIAKGILPFLLLMVVGILWNVFCVIWLAKRLLPKNSWFERAIAEMGQSMGVTATGLLLLRVVDPESETDAISAFGYKQIFHEPFMGGGLWTSMAIPLAITKGALPVFLISLGAVIIWLVLWAFLFRKQVRAPV